MKISGKYIRWYVQLFTSYNTRSLSTVCYCCIWQFTGIEIMMFFGFGYLMTFLKRYGMGAVGFTMLITVIGIQWGVLVEVSCDTSVCSALMFE